jgi:hypothetical protein
MSGAPDLAVVEPAAISWPAVIAGAVLAAGVSITLLTFGSAIGLSVSSSAPTWRDSSPWLWLLSGLFLIFIALCSFGFGGYVAGRMRRRFAATTAPEIEFRDGVHGLLVWALAVVIAAFLAVIGAAAIAPTMAPTAPAQSVTGETVIASELDTFFRSTGRDVDAQGIAYRRAEAARILLKTGGHTGLSQDDRDYLVGIAQRDDGLSQDEAAARADRAIADSAAEIHRARQAAVMQAFLVGAALLLGAAVAWFASAEGGRERELGLLPVWDWSFRRRTV